MLLHEPSNQRWGGHFYRELVVDFWVEQKGKTRDISSSDGVI